VKKTTFAAKKNPDSSFQIVFTLFQPIHPLFQRASGTISQRTGSRGRARPSSRRDGEEIMADFAVISLLSGVASHY
jgi:hypothetical protein